ncbi:MAG: hypothetical protein J1G06_00290 [Oscillospiraceae bacterium]|nr:hypothetical protein [Oscillospiraceae bacterium]
MSNELYKDITDLKNEHVFFAHIGKSFEKACKEQNLSVKDYDIYKDVHEIIYNCTRGAWEMRKTAYEKIEYVFAIHKAKVVGIYKVEKSLWVKRNAINNKYDFPIYPNIRNKEREYSIAFRDCISVSDAEKECLRNPHLSLNEFKQDILKLKENQELTDKKYQKWKNEYFFKKSYNPVPDNVNEFLGKILLFPIPHSVNIRYKYRTIYQYEHYNFIEGKTEIRKIYR